MLSSRAHNSMLSSHAHKWIRLLACWAAFVALIGCGFLTPEETVAEPVVAPVVAPTEEAPVAAPAGGGSCGRMQACCRAYVAAMGASVPASTCDAYNDVSGMPDSMCSQSMAGYRAGLQAMQKAVPSECN